MKRDDEKIIKEILKAAQTMSLHDTTLRCNSFSLDSSTFSKYLKYLRDEGYLSPWPYGLCLHVTPITSAGEKYLEELFHSRFRRKLEYIPRSDLVFFIRFGAEMAGWLSPVGYWITAKSGRFDNLLGYVAKLSQVFF